MAREEGVPDQQDGGARWALDHLFLDQDAIPTLVEVKRSSDTRIRREMVGQMLDYAANAVIYWPVEQLRTCEQDGEDPDDVLSRFLGAEDREAFWRSVKTNLQAGRIRMIFLADEIPNELARIVEFLNEQMDPAEVIAVEIPQYVGDGIRTLTPRVLGVTAKAQRRKSTGTRETRDWDHDSFLAQLEENCGSEARQVAGEIIAWSDRHLPRRWFGSGATNASFVPALDIGDDSYWPYGLYMSGHLEIKFQYIQNWSPFERGEKREELRQRLNQIQGVDISQDRLQGRPSFDVRKLVDPAALDHFLQTMTWVVNEIRVAAGLPARE